MPLQLQMLSSEHLPLAKCETLPNGNEIIFGIELDRIGRRVAYHFHRTHPGDVRQRGVGETVRVPAEQVLHVFHPIAEGQIRGVPWVAPAMVRLWLLDQYDDAELDRKKVAAMFAGFVTRPGPDDVMGEDSAQKDADGAALIGLQPGTMQLLLPGEDIKFSDPADVGGSYEAFQYRTLLACCSAMGVPYTNVTGDLRQANYSSLREGKLEFRRRIEQLQHGTLVFQLCRPVWQRWLRDAVLAGRARPAGLRLGPGPVPGGQVDSAEVGLGRPAQGPQGRDRGDRRRAQVPLRRDRERGLRRRGGRPPDRRRPCPRGGARAQLRTEGARAEPSVPSPRPTGAIREHAHDRGERCLMRRWYEFRAQAKGAAEIVIYDEIGAFGIPAKAFLDELKALGPVAELTVRINSPGGSVFDGVAIYNALKRHQAKVTVWIDGIAASIASMIAMAGDEVVMPENAMLVLHDPSGLVAGTAADMRATADALDKMAAAMVAAYRDKSGAGDAEIEALMATETWLSAEEAVELGLADRVEAPVRMAAHFDLSHFRNAPPQLAALAASVTAQEDEMSDSRKTRPRKPDAVDAAAADDTAPAPGGEQIAGPEDDRPAGAAAEFPRAPDGDPAAAAVAQQATPGAPADGSCAADRAGHRPGRGPSRRAPGHARLRRRGPRALRARRPRRPRCRLHRQGDAGRPGPPGPARGPRRRGRGDRHPQPGPAASVDPAPAAIDTAAIYAARNQNVR